MASTNDNEMMMEAVDDYSPQRGENSISPNSDVSAIADALFEAVSTLIQDSHARVSSKVNAEMTELYWQVGNTINEVLLGGKRAEYGAKIIQELASNLTQAYGRGWSAHHLRQCMRLAAVFPDEEILYAVRTKLNWTCIRTVMYIDEPLKRDFYIEMCKLNGWSSRTLQGRIKSMLYERTAIAKKPDKVIAKDLEQLREEGELSQDLVFRDPYFLDYLGLHGDYSERDLESAILAELQHFITELGRAGMENVQFNAKTCRMT